MHHWDCSNELRILWGKTVTVAGWQMVQTPNYIAPAIGAFFLFIAGHWNFDKKLENICHLDPIRMPVPCCLEAVNLHSKEVNKPRVRN